MLTNEPGSLLRGCPARVEQGERPEDLLATLSDDFLTLKFCAV
jgi:hypothetical protein